MSNPGKKPLFQVGLRESIPLLESSIDQIEDFRQGTFQKDFYNQNGSD